MEVEVPVEQQTQCSERDRFVAELEFIQALSNPQYLNCACLPARHTK